MPDNNNLYKKWIQLIFISEIILILTYAMFIILGYEEFTVWSQVGDYLFDSSFTERSNTLFQLFADKHPHAMRISLIYPIFQLADILNINVLTLYSVTILLLFILMYKLLLSVLKYYSITHMTSFILIFLLILSLFMHGRIAFAMFGNTLILYVLFIKIHFPSKMNTMKSVLYLATALWFCSVSSGTLMVAIGTIMLFYSLRILIELPYIQKKYITLFALLIVLLILASPIILQLVNKNLNYYDGSFIHMLDHGFGKYILKYFYLIGILLVISPYLLIKSINFFKKSKEFILPLSMIIASLSIGLFGFSSLVSGLSAYILFIYMYLNKNNLKVS